MIAPCKCVHADQDKFHGKGNRVHNESKSGWKCTVCSTLKTNYPPEQFRMKSKKAT